MSRMFRLRSTTKVLLAVGLLIGFLLAEAGLQFIAPHFDWYVVPKPMDGLVKQGCQYWSKYTHHQTVPNCTTVIPPSVLDGIEEISLEYNADGLRGPVIDQDPKQHPRLLLLGDSFLQAEGVPYEKTMGVLLNQLMGERLDVLQHGVSSWSPVTQLAWLTRYGERLDVDHVYLFVVDNDFFSASAFENSDEAYRLLYSFADDGTPLVMETLRAPPLLPLWLFRSKVVSLMLAPFGFTQIRSPSVVPEKVNVPESLNPIVHASSLRRVVVERLMIRLDPALWDASLRKGAAATLKSLRTFTRYLAHRDISLVVVYLPLGLDIDAHESMIARERMQLVEGIYFGDVGLDRWLREQLTLEGIAFLSLTQTLRETKVSLAPNGRNILYYSSDGHLNKTGHRAVAKALYHHLEGTVSSSR